MASTNALSRITKAVLAVAVFLCAFIFARRLWFPHTSEGQRHANVAAARQHALVVAPVVAKDKRFEVVRVSEWWSGQGYFLVSGFVDTEADLQDLKRLIASTHPPVAVAWQVEVVGTSEFARRHQQFQRDYCATNIVTAEEGLMAFRAWVANSNNPCEVLNRDSVIFSVDARLFRIKERLGETNSAEQFYRESVEARDRYLAYIQSLHLPDQARPLQPITSKDQLRELVDQQDKHFDVGWKKIVEMPDTVRCGDTLLVQFVSGSNETTNNVTQVVDPAGNISLPYIGKIRSQLESRYGGWISRMAGISVSKSK